MCQALTDYLPSIGQQAQPQQAPANAADVPLGEGLADQARLSILERRERIRRAVEEAS